MYDNWLTVVLFLVISIIVPASVQANTTPRKPAVSSRAATGVKETRAVLNGDLTDTGINFSLVFDGVDDHVSLPGLELGSSFSVSHWVYLNTDEDWQNTFGSETHLSFISYSDGKILVYIGDGSSWVNNTTTATGATAPGQWQHWTVTYDGSTLRFYLNGQLKDEVGVSTTVPTTEHWVGARNGQGSDYATDGNVDEVRIYNKALSGAQVQEIYSRTDVIDGLVANLPFAEGSGDTAYDKSGNNNHGAITGANWTGGLKDAEVYFEWGSSEGNLTNTTAPKSMTETDSFSETVTGLEPGKTYYYRAVAENEVGLVYGDTLSFTTPGALKVETGEAFELKQDSATIKGELLQIDTGYALGFDGNDDSVAVGTVKEIDNSDRATFVAWVYPHSSDRWNRIVRNHIDGSNRGGIMHGGNTGTVAMYMQIGGTSEWVETPINTYEWSHIVGTYDGNQFQIYVNGVLEGTLSTTHQFSDATGDGNVLIGTWDGSGSNEWDGLLDEISVYNKLLSETQINELYEGYSVTEGLIGDWPAANGTGDTLYDNSGNGYDGSISGATWTAGRAEADVYFQWGPTSTDLANTTPYQPLTQPDTFSQRITGLQSNSTYYYQAVATNEASSDTGIILSFTTPGVSITEPEGQHDTDLKSITVAGTTANVNQGDSVQVSLDGTDTVATKVSSAETWSVQSNELSGLNQRVAAIVYDGSPSNAVVDTDVITVNYNDTNLLHIYNWDMYWEGPDNGGPEDVLYWRLPSDRVGTASHEDAVTHEANPSYRRGYSMGIGDLTTTPGYRDVLAETVAVNEEKTYEMSARYYLAGSAGETAAVNLEVIWMDSAGSEISRDGLTAYELSGVGQWNELVTNNLDPPTGQELAYARVHVDPYEDGGGVTQIYWDTVELYETPTVTILSPEDGYTTDQGQITVSGEACLGADVGDSIEITVDGAAEAEVAVESDYTWSAGGLAINDGANEIIAHLKEAGPAAEVVDTDVITVHRVQFAELLLNEVSPFGDGLGYEWFELRVQDTGWIQSGSELEVVSSGNTVALDVIDTELKAGEFILVHNDDGSSDTGSTSSGSGPNHSSERWDIYRDASTLSPAGSSEDGAGLRGGGQLENVILWAKPVDEPLVAGWTNYLDAAVQAGLWSREAAEYTALEGRSSLPESGYDTRVYYRQRAPADTTTRRGWDYLIPTGSTPGRDNYSDTNFNLGTGSGTTTSRPEAVISAGASGMEFEMEYTPEYVFGRHGQRGYVTFEVEAGAGYPTPTLTDGTDTGYTTIEAPEALVTDSGVFVRQNGDTLVWAELQYSAVDADAFLPGDTLHVVYGSKTGGGPGLTVPGGETAVDTFSIRSDPRGNNWELLPAAEQPELDRETPDQLTVNDDTSASGQIVDFAPVVTGGGKKLYGAQLGWEIVSFPSGASEYEMADTGPVDGTTNNKGEVNYSFQTDTAVEGRYEIQFYYTADETVNDTITITTEPPALDITPDTVGLSPGDTTDFIATLLDPGSDPVEGQKLSWEITDTPVGSGSYEMIDTDPTSGKTGSDGEVTYKFLSDTDVTGNYLIEVHWGANTKIYDTILISAEVDPLAVSTSRLIADTVVVAGAGDEGTSDRYMLFYNPTADSVNIRDRYVARYTSTSDWNSPTSEQRLNEGLTDVYFHNASDWYLKSGGWFLLARDETAVPEADAVWTDLVITSDYGLGLFQNRPAGFDTAGEAKDDRWDALGFAGVNYVREGEPVPNNPTSTQLPLRRPVRADAPGGFVDSDSNARDVEQGVDRSDLLKNQAADTVVPEFEVSAPGEIKPSEPFDLSGTLAVRTKNGLRADSVVTDYTGDSARVEVYLSDGTIVPEESDPFTDGKLTQQFTVYDAAGTVTITFVDGAAAGELELYVQVNEPPEVDVIYPDTGAYVGGDVKGTYVISDPDEADGFGTAHVEYSADGGTTWREATLAEPAAVESVAMSVAGETHEFEWDSEQDLGSETGNESVRLRLRAYDGDDTGGWDTSPVFPVDNIQPAPVEEISSRAELEAADTGVDLHWFYGDTDAEYFNLYRVQSTADTSLARLYDTVELQLNPDSSAYLDTSVARGDSYFYYVTAVDTAGNESDSSPMTSAPHIELSKTSNNFGSSRPGDTFLYQINYVNSGFGPTESVVVEDWLPEETFLSDTAGYTVNFGPEPSVLYRYDGGYQETYDPVASAVRWKFDQKLLPRQPGQVAGGLEFEATIE